MNLLTPLPLWEGLGVGSKNSIIPNSCYLMNHLEEYKEKKYTQRGR